MIRYRKIITFYLLAILVGMLTGVLGSAFQWGIDKLVAEMQGVVRYAASVGIPERFFSPALTLMMVLFACTLVKRIAPEAAGSGIPEIEGALLHERRIRWRRLIPVKFLGGLCAIASNVVVGREGPTVQMGGSVGQMLGEFFRLSSKRCDALIAAGAAAGLATAFNAPLAGVLFVMEEMRRSFSLPFLHFKTVAISCVASNVVLHAILGDQQAIMMPVFNAPPLSSLWLFFVFGLLMGFIGVVFNRVLMGSLKWMDHRTVGFRSGYVVCVALLIGYLAYAWPEAVGGGYRIIQQSLNLAPGVGILAGLFLVRFVTTMLCYNLGVPGGIFAPMLALGTLLGLGVSCLFQGCLSNELVEPGMFAVAGMGALFSATVRAPVTGIVLVVEMTKNYALILPLMVSCLTATTVVQLAGVAPIYTQLLRRTLNPWRVQTGPQ